MTAGSCTSGCSIESAAALGVVIGAGALIGGVGLYMAYAGLPGDPSTEPQTLFGGDEEEEE